MVFAQWMVFAPFFRQTHSVSILVGALEHEFLIFPSWDDDRIWRTPSFFRGVGIPPISYGCDKEEMVDD